MSIRYIVLSFLPALLVFAGISVLSHQAGLKSEFAIVTDLVLRKGAHMVEYGALFLALFWGFWRVFDKHYAPAVTAALITAFILSLADEFHQVYVPGRSGSPDDIGFDVSGMLLAYVGIQALVREE